MYVLIVFLHECMHVWMNVWISLYVPPCMYACKPARMYSCTHIWYVCMCVYACIIVLKWKRTIFSNAFVRGARIPIDPLLVIYKGTGTYKWLHKIIKCDILSLISHEAREVPTKLELWGDSQRCCPPPVKTLRRKSPSVPYDLRHWLQDHTVQTIGLPVWSVKL